MIECVGLC